MAKGLRQEIPAGLVRAGYRPSQQRPAPAPPPAAKPAAAAVPTAPPAEAIAQGAIGVWMARGSDVPIYALSIEQAQAELQRRGAEGKLEYQGYVHLSEADRQRLQQHMDSQPARKPSTKAARARDSASDSANESSSIGSSSSGFTAEERQWIEEHGGVIGVVSEADAARIEADWERDRSSRDSSSSSGSPRGKGETFSVFSPDDQEWIEEHGGVIGVVSEADAARIETATALLKQYEVAPGQYDIDTALRKGQLSAAALLELGFSEAVVKSATERTSAIKTLDPYIDPDGSIRIVEAIRGGVPESAFRAAGIDQDSVALAKYYATIFVEVPPLKEAPVPALADRVMMHGPPSLGVMERYGEWMYRTYLTPYQTADNEYNVKAALDAGVDPVILRRAGVPNLAILQASMAEDPRLVALPEAGDAEDLTRVKASVDLKKAGILSGVSILPYRNVDGTYNLVAMIEGGKVSLDAMWNAGFSETQVSAAINEAIRRSYEKNSKRLEKEMKGDAVQNQLTKERAAYITENLMMHADPELPERSVLMPMLQRTQQWLNETTKETNPQLRTAGGFVAGLTFALMPVAMIEDLVLAPGITEKAARAVGYARGTANYFLTLPVATLNDPYWTIGEVAGMIAGPKGAVRAARTARVWVDPYGVPARAIGIEFSTGKVPLKGHNPVQLGLAMAEAQRQVMTGKLSGNVKVGSVEVHFRGTPIQHTVGDIVVSATPDVSPFAKAGTIRVGEAGMYTSVYLAERFLAASGSGKGASNPGIVLILTDSSRVRSATTGALRRVSESDVHVLRADQGLQGPAKIWRYDFETEITASPGSNFTRSPGNLRTRILGEKAGDFFVQYDGPTMPGLQKGQLVPVYTFLDQGVFRSPPSPAALYAAKLITLYESLKDVGQQVTHPSRTIRDIMIGRERPGIREIEANQVRQHMELAREIELEARANMERIAKRDRLDADTAYRKALTESYSRRAAELYEEGRRAEAAYQRAPEPFESAYRARLESNMRGAARSMTLQQAYRTVRPETRLPEVTVGELPRWMREERQVDTPRRPAPQTAQRTTAGQTSRTPSQVDQTPTDTTTTITIPSIDHKRTPPRRTRTPPPPDIITGAETEEESTRRKGTVIQPEDRQRDTTGRVQWKQGAWWIMVEPPPTEGERQRNVYYSKRPFWGVRKVKGNPEQTFARQGEPPRRFLYEMGATSADVHSYEKPHLRWRQVAGVARKRRGRVI